MPTSPILDLSIIDRTQVVVDRAELDKYLAQRGTFSVIDHLVHADKENAIMVGVKAIREDDWWAADHIPGRPMFPGALMIETAAQIASYDYSKNRILSEDDNRFVGFGGVEKCRFRGVVAPPSNLYLCVKLERSSSRMFRYQAEGYIERDGELQAKRVFEATVLGVLF